ncbi:MULTISPECIES: hypothetical protein [unclassified Dehalobacter]|uniref:hypothetical protein n=1 Tax=unclassified Dehalobacter TaxID=2635733 RepID=UPI00104DB723|nr:MULTISPECIES: hypothetical protein [unclassified Dehalobacter]TCX51909.1 hypothetical protein C1I36_06205 [Dehalobacter sp. 14DCB1]TCX52969.1 hypothetical protein C1I38_07885 [Dehalobacter sp. 12DCB1]
MERIPCIFWGGAKQMELTPAEVVNLRNEYRGAAQEVLEKTGSDHVLYYRDERDKNDKIIAAHFYVGPKPYTEEDFNRDVEPYKLGLIGAVHALR